MRACVCLKEGVNMQEHGECVLGGFCLFHSLEFGTSGQNVVTLHQAAQQNQKGGPLQWEEDNLPV